MINMAQGFDKGQFGKSMQPFEAITTSDVTPPAELKLPWILAEQEMVWLTLHDNILNVFITSVYLWMKLDTQSSPENSTKEPG